VTDRGERPDAGPVIAATATSATPTTSATSATTAPAVPVSAAAPAAPVSTAAPAAPVPTAGPAAPVPTAGPAVPVSTAGPAVPFTTAGPATPVATAGPAAGADVALAGSAAATAASARGRAGAVWWAQLPYALVLAATVGGLAWIWLGTRNVHVGMMTVASALLAAALFRLVLPERAAGLLVSRRRVADVLALASLGACIMAAVLVLPAPS
jgi:Protein of unknown function (DUF3017)